MLETSHQTLRLPFIISSADLDALSQIDLSWICSTTNRTNGVWALPTNRPGFPQSCVDATLRSVTELSQLRIRANPLYVVSRADEGRRGLKTSLVWTDVTCYIRLYTSYTDIQGTPVRQLADPNNPVLMLSRLSCCITASYFCSSISSVSTVHTRRISITEVCENKRNTSELTRPQNHTLKTLLRCCFILGTDKIINVISKTHLKCYVPTAENE